MRDSQQYCTHASFLGEAQRAKLDELHDDDRLALFLNLYHVMIIHGFVNGGASLNGLRKDALAAFFENTTIVVGYIQFSLNDIYLGILRANQPKPGGGLWGTTSQFSETLYPDKIALKCPSLNPIVHCCLSNLTTQSPKIVVYEGSQVHAQMQEVAAAFIQQQVQVSKAGLSLPSVFKEFVKDFGKTDAERIDFIQTLMDEEAKASLAKVLNKKGECGIKYAPKVTAFAWQYLAEVKDWTLARAKRFDWTEEKRLNWRAVAQDSFKQDSFKIKKSPRKSFQDRTRDGGSSSRIVSPKASVKDLLLHASLGSPIASPPFSPSAMERSQAEDLARERGWSSATEAKNNPELVRADTEPLTPRSKSSSGKKGKTKPDLIRADTEPLAKKEGKDKKKKDGKAPKKKSKTKDAPAEEVAAEVLPEEDTQPQQDAFDDMIDVVEPLKSKEQVEAVPVKKKKVQKTVEAAQSTGEGEEKAGTKKGKKKGEDASASKTGEGEEKGESKKKGKKREEDANASKSKKIKKKKATNGEGEEVEGSDLPSSTPTRGASTCRALKCTCAGSVGCLV